MTTHSSLRTACILAAVLSVLGAISLYAATSRTMRVQQLAPTLLPGIGGRPTDMIIGVGIHREFTGFDAYRSDEVLRQMGFESVRDDIGQSSGNATGGLLRSLALGGTLSSPLRSSSNTNVFIVSGGGSRQFANGIPLTAQERSTYYHFLNELGRFMSATQPILEIWNEWNLPTKLRTAGSAASYSALVDGAVPVLRNAFPRSTILSGAIGNDFVKTTGSTRFWDWTRGYLADGSWKKADGLSVHLYANCMAGIARQPISLVQRLNILDGMVRAANGGRSFPLYITEVGWPEQHASCGFNEAERAAFPAQFLLMAEAIPAIRGIWFYELRDGTGNRNDMENTFGFAAFDYQIKPSSCPLVQTIALLKTYRVNKVNIANGVATASLRSNAGVMSVVWSADGEPHRMPLPAGSHAKSLCAGPGTNSAMIDLTILPQIIYASAPLSAPMLR
jgi:hypothetical protein